MDRRNNQIGDNSLGLNDPISRRDFLNASLLASGSALLQSISPLELLGQTASGSGEDDWYGPGGVGDYSQAHGNSPAVRDEAHKIRDGIFDHVPADTIDTGEIYDLVVVGGELVGWLQRFSLKTKAARTETAWCLKIIPSLEVRHGATNSMWMVSA